MGKIRSENFRVTKELNFCYGHRLMDYEGKCKHPHGHNGKVSIELALPQLDNRGMVIDFNDIKNVIHSWIDEELDHKMLLKKGDPLIKILEELDEPVFVMEDNPTAENIAKLIFQYVRGKEFPVVKVQFWETPSSSAVYQEG